MTKMKDSGVKWIGEIPEDWEVMRLGTFYTQRNEKVSDKDYQPLSVTMQGIVPQLETAAKTNDGDNRKLVLKGDFAINSRSDRRGSCGISAYDGSVSLINTILCPQGDMDAGYYNWLFHTSSFSDEYYKWGHGIVDDLWTTRWSEMKNIEVPVPPLAEQTRISNYLDSKCTEIDDLVKLEERMITELQKYKQSVITETVTRGLNKTAKLKDSGVEWIGMIPEEWGVDILSMHLYEHCEYNSDLKETNLLSLSYGKIIRKNIDSKGGLLPESFNRYNIIEKGDIVLRLTDLQNDQRSLRTGLCKEKGIITSAYVTLRKRSNELSEYLHYYLHSCDINKIFYGMGSGVRQSMKYSEIRKLPLLLPPLTEQERISSYLDKKTEEIDGLIKLKESKIQGLKDYKKSLIYEYVTGKKKV